MKIHVKYAASSNLSYRGTWTFEVDALDWAELDENGRNELVDELVKERLANDIGYQLVDD